jgi:hypothetical protein
MWGGPLDCVGECDSEANRRKTQGRGTPTMTRLDRAVRVMVGVPLAGTLARHCTFCIFRQQSPLWSPVGGACWLLLCLVVLFEQFSECCQFFSYRCQFSITAGRIVFILLVVLVIIFSCFYSFSSPTLPGNKRRREVA